MAVFDHARTSIKEMLRRTSDNRLVWRGPDQPRRVALTFDDGPDERTPRYLDVLDRYRIAATFFVMGDLSERRPGATAEYLRRGHQVGSHGYDHQRFTALSPRALWEQLARAKRAIGPVHPGRMWVRPPYGAMGPVAAATMLAADYVIGMWSLDSYDYSLRDAMAIVERCTPVLVRPGDVLLFHEGNDATIEALPHVIERLRADGYEFVTMADLIAT